MLGAGNFQQLRLARKPGQPQLASIIYIHVHTFDEPNKCLLSKIWRKMDPINDDLSRLRNYIEKLSHQGVQRVPPEPKLCEIIDVSRGRIRTLLKRFEDEGLIWRHVGKGTFIGSRSSNLNISGTAQSIGVADIIDARLVLEPQVAALAAIKANAIDISRMDSCLTEMRDSTSFSHWKRLDQRFHRLLAEATHNTLIVVLFDTLHSQGLESLHSRIEEVFGSISGPKDATDNQHIAILDAVRLHAPERAEQMMREHLQSVRVTLFGLR